jgi:hypothetical protein
LSVVALTLFADFQLIVNLFLNPNHEGSRADIASATIRNKSFLALPVTLASSASSALPVITLDLTA